MGAVNSVEAATEEANAVMAMIDRKCNSYMLSVEHTNSVVDITLDGLRKEIFALIEPLRSSKNLVDLGMEDMGAVLQQVETHANTQKFIIQRLLDIMFDAQSTFEEMADNTMANADVDDVPEVLLDEGIMTKMRLLIENLLYEYELELQAKDVSSSNAKQRCDELHRLLFKLAEATVSDMVDITVSEMKDTFLEDIDHMISLHMMTGQFKVALEAKECLQAIISKSLIARVSLEALPFSRRVEVEAGQDEIEQFVNDLVRKVQMYHCNESTQNCEQLMNLDVDFSDNSDSVSTDESDVSSSDDDQSTEPEDSDEDTEKEEEEEEEKEEEEEVPTSLVKSKAKKAASNIAATQNSPISVKKDPASAKKTPLKTRATRKRKDAATPVDDEVSVTDRRVSRPRRK